MSFENLNKRYLLVALLVLSSLLLFSYKLGAESYWLDEMITLYRTQTGWKLHYAAWPPLYFWLAWIWARIFGISEVALRFLSVLWGVIAVVSVFYLGSLFSIRTGIFASVLTMFNPIVVKYAQEARGYTMLLALSAFSAAMFVKVLKGSPGEKDWLYLALVNIAGSLTHYSFILFMIGGYTAAFSFISIYGGERSRELCRHIVKSLKALFLFAAVYFPVVSKAILKHKAALSRHTAVVMLNLLGVTLWQRVFIFALVGWSIILAVTRTKWRRWAFFLLVTVAVFLTIMTLKNQLGRPLWRARYLLPIVPLLSVVSAYPMANIDLKKSLLLITVWIFLTVSYLVPNYYHHTEKANWREAATWILSHNRGEPVIVNWYKYYRLYYLDCSFHRVQCWDLKKLLKRIKKGRAFLGGLKGLWVLYPQGGKWRVNKEMEESLKEHGFTLDWEIRVGRRSRILHFIRKVP